MKKNIILTIVAGLLAICVGGFFYKRYHVPPVVDIPTLALTDLNGNKVSLQSYSGHPLFISFFATWCGPCIRELPELVDFKSSLADNQLQVVCISDESIDKLQKIQARVGDGLTILHAEHNIHDIGIYTYPTNYIYDARGKKIYDQVNPDHWSDPTLINRIRLLLD